MPKRALCIVGTVAVLLTGNVIGAGLVLLWAYAANVRPGRLGFRRPRAWTSTLAGGAVCGVALKLLLKAFVMPLFGLGQTNQAYAYLVGNTPGMLRMLVVAVLAAGVGEEIVWRGFLFDRLDAWLPASRYKPGAILLTTSALFGLAHYHDQGVPGVAQSVITGLVFGGTFLWARNIWLPMVLHASFDVTAVLLIYWNVDSAVGRSIFR